VQCRVSSDCAGHMLTCTALSKASPSSGLAPQQAATQLRLGGLLALWRPLELPLLRAVLVLRRLLLLLLGLLASPAAGALRGGCAVQHA
jgi:hypothetical protein